jgi:maleate isomerase
MTGPLESCQSELERLLADTGASRTTLRLQADDGMYPVEAEALTDGVTSLRGAQLDIRSAPTFLALERDRGLLVQEDLLTADPAPPPELIEAYGARAQMLAPLERDGEVVGVVSVHEAKGPRPWTTSDRDALTRATAAMAATLGLESGA